MKNRPKWSAGAFAQRVKMSEDDLWLVVEGRDHDRPHYENLLNSTPSTRDRRYSIRLAETIELHGAAAGGKAHVLALHDHFERIGSLTSENNSGKSAIAFMVDQDREAFERTLRNSTHIIYTFATDVEADILLNADIWAAIQNAYGIDSEVSAIVKKAIQEPSEELLSIWKEWLTLGLVALYCGQPSHAPLAGLSRVNRNRFGPVDSDEVGRVESNIRSSVDDKTFEEAQIAANSYICTRGVQLLKGRWIAKYIEYLVKTELNGEIIRANVDSNRVIDTALAALSYSGKWVMHYDKRFSEVLLVAETQNL